MSRYLNATFAFVLTATSLFAAFKSYVAIISLQKYEERSKQAAKLSQTAAHELHKTRVTQGSSAGAVSALNRRSHGLSCYVLEHSGI